MIKFNNQASEFVALTHYARWVPGLNRRETWEEVVERVLGFLKSKKHLENVPARVWLKIKQGVESFSTMPSMRLVATAGNAADKDNTCIYNCSYMPVDSFDSFSELMYILMCGTGVGFSVERHNTDKLPVVAYQTGAVRDDYIIEDSREGWSRAYKFALQTWFNGDTVHFNYDKIRPYGARLNTMGGRASGPEPLKVLLSNTYDLIMATQGRQLKPIECHDLCCMIAENVIMGGKRRSAMISFSDLEDDEMRDAKTGHFPSYRYMANNTTVYKGKPSSAEFIKEWGALALSGSGERGIFNVTEDDKRTNPCGEILLKPYQFCNLSEAIIRPDDDISDLVEKVKTATWLGVIQSTFTSFPFIRRKWHNNAINHRIIGVSLTGQMDNKEILTDEVLKQLKKVVDRTARHAAGKLNITVPTSFTCVKPSGTVSQLVNSSSGCHPRYSDYYIRRYRVSKSDPVFRMLVEQGVPWNPEVQQTKDNFTTGVFSFPIKSPDAAITRDKMSAIEQIDWYLKLQKNWCTHNTSITVYVKNNEWLKVGSYVYENWENIIGLSFLPYDGHVYDLAPYEEISKDKYAELIQSFPTIDFSKLGEYEQETGDTTKVAQEFACTGGKCELT